MRTIPVTAGLATLAAAVMALGGCSQEPSAPKVLPVVTSDTSSGTSSPTPGAMPTGVPGKDRGDGRGGSGDGPIRYVALGDSFVAGPGIGATSGTCLRSDKNFPSLLAERLEVESFTDASCSGATTSNYTQPQGENPPQLDAVGPDTTLVTLGTMGGNDVGLVMTAASCVAGECGGPGSEVMAERIDALVPTIVTSVEQVRERAPEARILLVGYGTYLPEHTCAALRGVTDAEVRYLQGTIDRLSDAIARAAEQTGVEFVDMRTLPGVLRHTPCAPVERQWIRGLSGEGDGMTFHPSAAGMRAMADQVERTLARG